MRGKHVIIINGTGGVGKDTLIEVFSQDVITLNVSTIDPVKHAARCLGWNPHDKSDDNRKALADLKEFWDLHDYVWGGSLEWVLGEYKSFLNSQCEWMFIHCREPENINRIVKKIPDAKTVLVTREGVESHGNSSDDNVSNYDYDLIFVNDGTITESGTRFKSAIRELFKDDKENDAMEVKIVKLNTDATTPKRGSSSAAGYDLYSTNTEPVAISPGSTVKFPLGFAIEIPEGYYGAIYARSGLATKLGLRPANCVGVVDSDYRGEVVVALHNDSGKIQAVYPKDRIAQLILRKYDAIEFVEVDSLEDSERGEDGFGSTGSN